MTRVVLASQSPARLSTLRHAGVIPDVMVSGVDEAAVTADSPKELVRALARAKGQVVTAVLSDDEDTIVLACDTVLEVGGRAFGKPRSDENAIERWKELRGTSGLIHTGHYVAHLCGHQIEEKVESATTRVWFAHLSDDEIAAYARTGEPRRVAGGFTVDSLGGAFVSKIEGDYHNVVGISLPLLRLMLADMGIAWTSLWQH